MEGSPLQVTFDGWTLTRTRLMLGRAVETGMPVVATADGHVRLAPELDYTRVADPITYYDIFSKSGHVVHLSHVASVWITPLGLDAQDTPIDLVQMDPSMDVDVLVGFEHMRPLIVSNSSSDSRPARAAASATGPLASVDRGDYLWVFVGVLLSALLWHPGLSHRLYRAKRTWPAERAATLLDERWMVLTRLSSLCIFLGLYVACLCIETWRQAREKASPYGDHSTLVSDITYWTAAAYALAVATLDLVFGSACRSSFSRVFHRTSACYAVCWLLLLAQFDEAINAILLVVFAALFTIHTLDALLYSSGPEQQRWSWWSHAFVLLFSAWLFAYYELAAYIEERWPTQPSSWLIDSITLVAVLTLGAVAPFFAERSSYWLTVSRKLSAGRHGKTQTKTALPSRPSPMYVALSTQTGAVAPMNF